MPRPVIPSNAAIVSAVETIMTGFGQRTGLPPSSAPPRRYLWTDAFAVCNDVGLYRRTNEETWLQSASDLVEQVHTTLGRYRDDDRRSGWLSGLSEREGRAHPTRGGLRIGKGMGERGPDEPLEERSEWDRDGQYFHYLVKWMHALDCVARASGRSRYIRWALELAKAVYAGFVHTSPFAGRRRLYWKMSIDLSYPLVASMGHHDPLDGWITFEQLRSTASGFSDIPPDLDLTREISDLRAMCQGVNWSTDDSLGIGGLLTDAHRLTQLIVDAEIAEGTMLVRVLDDACNGLVRFSRGPDLESPAEHRLAFRELGLSIGVHAIEHMREMLSEYAGRRHFPPEVESRLSDLSRYLPLGRRIEGFWQEPAHRQSRTWHQHRDINEVMLATSLAPDGFLILR